MLEKTKKEVARTYNPLVLFDDLRTDLEQLWEKPWLPFTFRRFRTEKMTPWTPKMDVFEKDGELILRAHVRGLHLGGFALAVDQNEVIVDADVWGDAAAGSAGGERHEHLHGRLPLPFAADASRLTGRVEHDVLEVHIPLACFAPPPAGEETM